ARTPARRQGKGEGGQSGGTPYLPHSNSPLHRAHGLPWGSRTSQPISSRSVRAAGQHHGLRCPLSVVRCLLSLVRWPLSVVRCPLSVVRCPGTRFTIFSPSQGIL